MHRPAIFTPINPKAVAVGAAAVNFAAIKQATYISLKSTCDAFYTINGTATVDGNACHFLSAGSPLNLQVKVGDVISIIGNTGNTGNAFVTEWA